MGSVRKRNFTLRMLNSVLLGILLSLTGLYAIETPEVYVQLGHTGPVMSIALSPDGRYLVSGSYDGTVRIWDVSTGKELVQMVSFTNREWTALSPEGYYTASAEGDSHLLVRMGTQVYSIDQYRSTLYRPDVVEAVLQGRDIAEVLASAGGTSKVTPTSTSAFQAIAPPFW